MTARTKAYIYLIITIVIWGAAGPVIKNTLNYFDPVVFLTYRFFLTSLVLIPLILFFHPYALSTLNHLTAKDWLIFIGSSLLGTTVQLLLLFKGFELTSSIDGVLISSTSPILSVLAGWWLLKEHVTRREKIGAVIAFLGSVVIIIKPMLETHKLFSGNSLGNLLILLANFAWVGHSIISKTQLRHNLSPLLITTANFFIGFLSMSVILFFSRSMNYEPITNNLSAHLGVLYMALLSGALAYFLFQKAQKSIETSEANTFLFLQPVVATPLAYLWLGENVSPTFIVGSVIIGLGVILSNLKFKR